MTNVILYIGLPLILGFLLSCMPAETSKPAVLKEKALEEQRALETNNVESITEKKIIFSNLPSGSYLVEDLQKALAAVAVSDDAILTIHDESGEIDKVHSYKPDLSEITLVFKAVSDDGRVARSSANVKILTVESEEIEEDDESENDLSKPTLIYTYAETSDEIWTDKGSGAMDSMSIWRSTHKKGYYPLGDSCMSGHEFDFNTQEILIKGDQSGVTEPEDYKEVWRDTGTGSSADIVVWRPVPAEGYVCLGDIGTSGEKPAADLIRCVEKQFVGDASGSDKVWDTAFTGADVSAACYVANVAGSQYLSHGMMHFSVGKKMDVFTDTLGVIDFADISDEDDFDPPSYPIPLLTLDKLILD